MGGAVDPIATERPHPRHLDLSDRLQCSHPSHTRNGSGAPSRRCSSLCGGRRRCCLFPWTRTAPHTARRCDHAWDWLDTRLPLVTSHLGVPSIVLVLLLATVGVVTLVTLRRVALALVVPLIVMLNMVASAARRYPFVGLYEAKTSLFWLVGVLM